MRSAQKNVAGLAPAARRRVESSELRADKFENHFAEFQIGIQAAGETAGEHHLGRTGVQKAAHGFLGVLAADADEDGENARPMRCDLVKRRGFFFQGKTDRAWTWRERGQCGILPTGRQHSCICRCRRLTRLGRRRSRRWQKPVCRWGKRRCFLKKRTRLWQRRPR